MKPDDNSVYIKYHWPGGHQEFKLDRKHLPYLYMDFRVISLANREYRAVVKGMEGKIVHESPVLKHDETRAAIASITNKALFFCQEALKRAQV